MPNSRGVINELRGWLHSSDQFPLLTALINYKPENHMFYGLSVTPTVALAETPDGRQYDLGQEIHGAPVIDEAAPIGLAGLAAGAAWTRKLRQRIRQSAEASWMLPHPKPYPSELQDFS